MSEEELNSYFDEIYEDLERAWEEYEKRKKMS